MSASHTITADLAARLLSEGETIVDIGQLSPQCRSLLRKLVERGAVEQFTCTHFPAPKKAWRLMGACS